MADCVPSSAATVLAALVNRSVPAYLDGSTGTNRVAGHREIDADGDWDAVQTWLSVYKEKRSTYLAYEKEVTRFYVWVLLTLQKPLSSVIHEDWRTYREFLADPQPSDMWVSTAKRPRVGPDGSISPYYRPFAGPLQPRSIQFAERAIWRMFTWLRCAGYLATNPLKLQRESHVKNSIVDHSERVLPDYLWTAVLSWLAKQPRNTVRQCRNYARIRWMMALFYGTGLRSSEAIAATMGDISSQYDKDTDKLRTFINVIGKGSKRREVMLSDHVLQELRIYRSAFALSADPLPGECTPLIFSIQIRKGLQPITRQSLYAAFKKLFDAVADEMEREGNAGHERVRGASTHWLRRETTSVHSHLELKHPLQEVRAVSRSVAR